VEPGSGSLETTLGDAAAAGIGGGSLRGNGAAGPAGEGSGADGGLGRVVAAGAVGISLLVAEASFFTVTACSVWTRSNRSAVR